eukprot:CAMPEP_0181311544 /NCGR_PEP_ID=MMETSP1101-20121128/13196_1 /TAXON_ID=46948 /ORGANISM="Rhodomonas abbreviata, Strain Caron Lab Isolate" /LENGTH=668 /DNA_ID=CAMNT_0023418287 /DNA_START=84 /DNA_END=2090 /DNA_ORIENTATION=-
MRVAYSSDLVCAAGLVSLLLLQLGPGILAQNPQTTPASIEVQNFQCFDCVFEIGPNGLPTENPRKIRAIFMDSGNVVENPTAQDRARELGIDYSCNDPALALPECFDAKLWNSGWVGALASTIFANLGVEVIAMTHANFSLNSAAVYSGGSSYTRCVWEVRLGMADICVGDFWETNERRMVAPFTSSFDLDTMRLVTMPGGSSGFDPKNLLGIFKPLQPTVWAVTVAMFFFTAFLMWFVEQGTGNEDFEYEDSIQSNGLRQLEGSVKSIWLSLLGMVSAAPAHTPTRWSGRLIVLGYAFMLYITAASYTANLAQDMVAKKVIKGKVETLAELGEKGTKLCLLEAMSPLIDAEVVKPENIVGFGWYGPMLEMTYNGDCDAAVIGKTEYQTYVLGQTVAFPVCTDPNDVKKGAECADPTVEEEIIDLPCGAGCKDEPDKDRSECPESCPHYRKYCEFQEVVDGEFQLAIGLGMPVNNELQDYMSAWIVPLKLDRTVSRLRQQYVADNAPDVCNVEGGDAVALTPEDMAGVFVVSGGIMVIGLIVYIVQLVIYRDKNAASNQEEESPADQVDVDGGAIGKEAANGGKVEDVPGASYSEEDKAAKNIVDALSSKIELIMKRLDQLEEMDVNAVQVEEAARRKPSAENGPNGNAEDISFGGLFGVFSNGKTAH